MTGAVNRQGRSTPRHGKRASRFSYFNASLEAICLIVMYLRFSLSLRNVEDLQSQAKKTALEKFGDLCNAQDELSPQAVRIFAVARPAGRGELILRPVADYLYGQATRRSAN